MGSLNCVRRAVEQGIPQPLEIEEYSHFGMIARYMAGAAHLPFFPLHSYDGTDMAAANPLIRRVADPYGAGSVAVVPPLNPDVAIIHAQRADASGNTQLWGLLGVQAEVAFARATSSSLLKRLCLPRRSVRIPTAPLSRTWW